MDYHSTVYTINVIHEGYTAISREFFSRRKEAKNKKKLREIVDRSKAHTPASTDQAKQKPLSTKTTRPPILRDNKSFPFATL
jgi:hypothetical protein